jgi:hypothetical protein
VDELSPDKAPVSTPVGRSDAETPSEAGLPEKSGALATARTWGQGLTARSRGFLAKLEAARPKHPTIEIGFRWLLRDRQIAGGVLGGGLAYRFFFWFLALSVFAVGGLGFASRSKGNVAEAAQEVGLGESVAGTVASAARQAESSRWWLIIVGGFLVLWFSWGLLRALWLTHAAAWRIHPPTITNGPKAFALVVATPFLLAALSAGAGWIRDNVDAAVGAAATVALSVAFATGWLWVSMRLPSRDVPWTAFLPGAILLGVGLNALHIFTVYYLSEKLAHSAQLYGVLGLAATALFYLFLIGRGVIWAAELNAIVWEVRHPTAAADEPAPAQADPPLRTHSPG